jgi:hypothetical protein
MPVRFAEGADLSLGRRVDHQLCRAGDRRASATQIASSPLKLPDLRDTCSQTSLLHSGA